jgi:hypothetical protein
MKTLKLRSPAETMKAWGFSTNAYSNDFSLAQGADREALRKVIESGRKSIYALCDAASEAVLKKQNPWMSEREVDTVASVATRSLKDGEAVLFARYVLNEFLAESDDELNYGEFVEANWDRILGDLYSSKIKQTPHVMTIFNYSFQKDFVVLIRPTSRKSTAEAIYKLSLGEVRTLMTMNYYNTLVAKSGAVESLIAALLAHARGEVEALPSRKVVMRNLNKAFVKSFAQETEKNFDRLEDANIAYSKEMRAVSRKIFDDATYTDVGLVSTAVMAPVAEWLGKNAENLRYYELSALIHALHNPPALVTTGGKSVSAATVLKAATEADSTLAMMKVFAETILTAKTELPTIDQWLDGITDGTVANSITSEITVTLLAGSVKKLGSNPELANFRRGIASFQNY